MPLAIVTTLVGLDTWRDVWSIFAADTKWEQRDLVQRDLVNDDKDPRWLLATCLQQVSGRDGRVDVSILRRARDAVVEQKRSVFANKGREMKAGFRKWHREHI